MDLKPRNVQPEKTISNWPRDRFVPRRPVKPKQYYLVVFVLMALCFLFTGVLLLQFWPRASETASDPSGRGLDYGKDVLITASSPTAKPRDQSCTFHTCFDVYHCGYNDDNRISVYIYPPVNHLDEEGLPITLPVSKEFHEVLQTVMDSIYYTNDPEKACLFLPPLDLLNQNNIRLKETSKILASLPRWNEGINHLLFNMLPGSTPDYNTTLDVNHDRALLAGGGFSTWTYRTGYDVSIPIYNPLTIGAPLTEYARGDRRWLLISSQFGLHSEYFDELSLLAQHHKGLLLL